MSSTACDDKQTEAGMTRDELLTKLAMEMGEWPSTHRYMQWDGDNWYATDMADQAPFSKIDYLQRRTELINKPPWGEAPEWAKWLAQDDSGVWHWYAVKIGEPGCDDYEWGVGVDYSDYEQASTGTIPDGHDWRDTLEKRPIMGLYDAQDALANAYAEDSDSESALSQALSMPSKYHVRIHGQWCDVYDVLMAFGVTNPADQHALKKMLMPGKRGAKGGIQDRREAIQSLHRAIELEGGA